MIVREIEIVDLDPEELAAEFWEMPSDKQARFFVHLAFVASSHAFAMQMQHLTREKGLTDTARSIMRQIGTCAERDV